MYMNHFLFPQGSIQCSAAPLLFPLTFRTQGQKFTDTLLNRHSTVYSKNAHSEGSLRRMRMFMDSNKLQNYENISSSDQSQV